jgi:hypothetical protein
VDIRIEWVLQDFSVRAPAHRYEGHWQAFAADLEEEARWDSLTEALAWGRARAPVVLLTLWVGSPQIWVIYSAGESPRPRFLVWHEVADPDTARVEHYSGTVQIREWPYERDRRDTFSLMTEIRSSGETETTESEGGLPLVDALELARVGASSSSLASCSCRIRTRTSTLA